MADRDTPACVCEVNQNVPFPRLRDRGIHHVRRAAEDMTHSLERINAFLQKHHFHLMLSRESIVAHPSPDDVFG